MNGIYHFRQPLPPPDRQEALRYAGCRQETADMAALLNSCIDECADVFTPQVCAIRLPITHTDSGVMLGDIAVPSRLLADTLAGCDAALVFAATVGHGIDRLITRYSRLSPARAVMLQALGAERIECLCDLFCATSAPLTRRVSPGYGDIPLSLQTDLCRLLDTPRRIGVTLSDSLLMAPTKSVTAIAGIPTEEASL